MCGRYVIVSPPEALRRMFGYGEQPNMPPRYNIAPTQPVPVVTGEAGARHLRLMRWGFLPAWLKDPRGFPLLINARAETVAEKAAFRNAIRRRRCLLPADGYYEWQMQGARKQPFYIHARDGAPIAFAGVAETWCGPNGEEVDTVAIVTAQAPPDLAGLHHRVPVTIGRDDFAVWLDTGADLGAALALAAPPPAGRFGWHPVSNAVNRVSNDDARLIAALSEAEMAEEARRAEAGVARARPGRSVAKADVAQGSLF
jgi:putative SOS response-associated peptidase YedK